MELSKKNQIEQRSNSTIFGVISFFKVKYTCICYESSSEGRVYSGWLSGMGECEAKRDSESLNNP